MEVNLELTVSISVCACVCVLVRALSLVVMRKVCFDTPKIKVTVKGRKFKLTLSGAQLLRLSMGLKKCTLGYQCTVRREIFEVAMVKFTNIKKRRDLTADLKVRIDTGALNDSKL